MRLHLTGRNVEITPQLRQLLARKLSRIERLLNDSAVSAQVVLSRERYRHLTDIALHARGDHVLAGVGSAASWPDSMNQALEKITQQAQRLTEKWKTRKRRGDGRRQLVERAAASETGAADIQTPPAPERVRYPVRRHTIRAALTRLNAADEPFVLFRHGETMRLSLVFRRKDGSVGLIELEA